MPMIESRPIESQSFKMEGQAIGCPLPGPGGFVLLINHCMDKRPRYQFVNVSGATSQNEPDDVVVRRRRIMACKAYRRSQRFLPDSQLLKGAVADISKGSKDTTSAFIDHSPHLLSCPGIQSPERNFRQVKVPRAEILVCAGIGDTREQLWRVECPRAKVRGTQFPWSSCSDFQQDQ